MAKRNLTHVQRQTFLCLFLSLRSLSCQRISLHKNMFFSYIFNSIATIIWLSLTFANSQAIHDINPVSNSILSFGSVKPHCLTLKLPCSELYDVPNLRLPHTGTFKVTLIHFLFYQVSCKVLAVLIQYLSTSNYFWMLCQGIYLHTLIIVAVFVGEQQLFWYYILGWGEFREKDLQLKKKADCNDWKVVVLD